MKELLSGLIGLIEDLQETMTIDLYEFLDDYELERTDENLNEIWNSIKDIAGVESYSRFFGGSIYKIRVCR